MNLLYTYEGKSVCLLALTGRSGNMPMRSALVAARKIDDLSELIPAVSADLNPAGGLRCL